MTGLLRCRLMIGLGVLISMGTLSPVLAVAASPSPTPTSTQSAPGPVVPDSTPSSSTSYKLSPDQFSMMVSPTRLVITSADIRTTQSLSVINRGQAPMNVTVGKRNFSAATDGSLNYEQNAPYAAASWVAVSPTKFKVMPGATQIVTARVTSPSAPEPGDHQMAIVFLVAAGRTAGNVKINRGIATPVYISTAGPVVTSAVLTGLSAPGFATSGPVAIKAQIHNTGTVHRDFRGATALTVAAAGQPTTFPDFTVPRGATRDVTAEWEPPFMCICHVGVTFGNNNAPLQTATVRVIVFPWPLLTGLLAAVLLVIIILRLFRRRYRAQVLQAAAALPPVSSNGDG